MSRLSSHWNGVVVPVKTNFRRNMPHPPRFRPGDVVNAFEVVENLGYSRIHPKTKRHYSKGHYWFLVKCSCGSKEILSQAELGRKLSCNDCAKEERSKKANQQPDKEPLPPGVPDFAKMKL